MHIELDKNTITARDLSSRGYGGCPPWPDKLFQILFHIIMLKTGIILVKGQLFFCIFESYRGNIFLKIF